MTTRERIIEEALTLFAENGYDGTGVERIAERVGIKAPSLYKHFKGKEDILNAIIDEAEARKAGMRNPLGLRKTLEESLKTKRNSCRSRWERSSSPCMIR